MQNKFTEDEKLYRMIEIVHLHEDKGMKFNEISNLFYEKEHSDSWYNSELFDIGPTRVGNLYLEAKKNGVGNKRNTEEQKSNSRMTDTEKLLIKTLPNKWKWITRDRNGDLCLFENKPIKYEDSEYIEPGKRLDHKWINNTRRYVEKGVCGFPYTKLFGFIRWSDKEPTRIYDLLLEIENES